MFCLTTHRTFSQNFTLDNKDEFGKTNSKNNHLIYSLVQNCALTIILTILLAIDNTIVKYSKNNFQHIFRTVLKIKLFSIPLIVA